MNGQLVRTRVANKKRLELAGSNVNGDADKDQCAKMLEHEAPVARYFYRHLLHYHVECWPLDTFDSVVRFLLYKTGAAIAMAMEEVGGGQGKWQI